MPSSLKVSDTATGRSHTARTACERRPRLIERGHGLEEEEVDAALGQALGLLAVGGHRVVEGDAADGLERLAERARCEPATRARPAAASRATRAPSRLILRTWASSPWGPSLKRWAPKVLVSMTSAPASTYSSWTLAHEVGVREVELVEAAVQEDAAGVEHGAHGAVADEDAFVQALEQGLHGDVGGAGERSLVGIRRGALASPGS